METVLEIIKYTFPSLVVFFTVFFLMKFYTNGQLHRERLKYQHEQKDVTLPLRLQAYERLILLCERVSVDDLLLRLRTADMTGPQLKNVLMLAVKQEFDHNLAQQLYVSTKLWQVLTAAKNQLLEQIFLAEKEAGGTDANAYSQALLKLVQENNPIQTAKRAVIKEGQMYF